MDVTKWILFPLFFLLITNSFSQTINSDSLQSVSQNILERKVDFFQKEGKLTDVLAKLSEEHNIKFSYSNDRVRHILVKEEAYKSVQIHQVLSNLLNSSGFNFILVGRMVVIVPQEIKPVPIQTPSKPTATTPAAQVKDHIYLPESNNVNLPLSEIRRIRKYYRAELRWAKRRQKLGLSIYGDTVSNKLPEDKVSGNAYSQYPYYVSLGVGVVKYKANFKSTNLYPWASELAFKYTAKISPGFGIGFGVIKKHWIIGSGITYHKLLVEGQGQQTISVNKNKPKVTYVSVDFSDKYSIVSIPFQAIYFRQWNKALAGVGPIGELQFIGSKIESGKFQSYMESKDVPLAYTEENPKFSPSLGINFQGGYVLLKNLAILNSVKLFQPLKPKSINTLYKLSGPGFQYEISIQYLFNKGDARRLLRRG